MQLSSFFTVLTLSVGSARPVDGHTDCGALSGSTQSAILKRPLSGVKVGDELPMTREIYMDLTPEGVESRMLWSTRER